MATGEVFVRIRGSGMVAVDELINRKKLVFDVVETRRHGVNLDQTARKILAVYPQLLDALLYACGRRCHIRFHTGRTVSFDPQERRFLVGIDCNPDEAARLIGGTELQRIPTHRVVWWLLRLSAPIRP